MTTPKSTENLIQYKVKVTSFNSEVGQTDASPCIGAAGTNICELAKKGVKIIAVSQDMRKQFPMKSKILLESDNPSIHGCYEVHDVMNKRFTKRVDLYFLDRKDNQGGTAHISNKIDQC